jgi:hypothetical protein
MLLKFLLSILFLHKYYAINTKYLSNHKYIKIHSQRESYACQIIKQRQKQYLIEYNSQQKKSRYKQPYKPLYIPESKNC